jgi:(p)ppGpp synthase/HD superfamily hydrolase
VSDAKRDSDAPPATPASDLAESETQLHDATRLAWDWHGRQTRKGKPTSYMSHLLQVQGLVIEYGGDAEQVIAALFHDALEDAESPAQREGREIEIRTSFSIGVLKMVLDCTDTAPDEAGTRKGPWRVRKERYLAQLAVAEPRSLLVAACDKRHNLSDLISDLRHEGPQTFDRFNAGAVEQLWYFESLATLFRANVPPRLARDLDGLLAELRDFVTASGTRGR